MGENTSSIQWGQKIIVCMTSIACVIVRFSFIVSRLFFRKIINKAKKEGIKLSHWYLMRCYACVVIWVRIGLIHLINPIA